MSSLLMSPMQRYTKKKHSSNLNMLNLFANAILPFSKKNAKIRRSVICFQNLLRKYVCLGDFDPEYDENGDPLSSSKICEKYVMKTQSAIDQRLETVRSKLILDRLGDSDGRGSKLEIRASRKAEHRFYVANHKPELYDWIFENVDGTRPELDSNLTNTKSFYQF